MGKKAHYVQTLLQKESPMKTRTKEYPGVQNKVVKYVETFEEDEDVYIGIRFTDDTHLTIVVSPQPPIITTAELMRWKGGNSSKVRTYTSRVR